jgi:hypothetical protein
MAKEKSLVEEAIIQMKNLEEAVAENAKGILASTMKEEIKELVKESLSEQEEDDMEIDTDVEMEEPEMDDMEGDEMDTDNDELDMDTEMDMDMGDEEDTIDLTGIEDEDEILRVFSLAGPEDNIVVVKDDAGNINLKDEGKEYMIVGEGDDDDYTGDMEEMEGVDYGDMEEEFSEMYDVEEGEESIEDIVERVFMSDDDEYGMDDMDDMNMDYMDIDDMDDYMDLPSQPEEDRPGGMFYEEESDGEEIVYEIEMDEMEDMEEGEYGGNKHDFKRRGGRKMGDVDGHYKDYEMEEGDVEALDDVMESKMTVKPKGVGMGSPNKRKVYSNKPNMEGGFKTIKKKVNKTMGTGKAKFEYKEGENMDGKMKTVKKDETKEAARTYGNGSKSGRGLRKAITPNRNLTFESTAKEVQILREKNEEYRKALNVFRNKLNEVAVFNSNLAYATRLFTEHSTSKQEKINILRRFDGVESLKESKNLYKTIKDELSVKTSQPMNESIERKIENVQVTGSAVSLIESKTYENPQFLRMKDLMAKIK